jgi:hypothetical protein
MSSQLNPSSDPDARLDHVLQALRTTEPPAGLEQRIAARLALARAQSLPSRSRLSYTSVILNVVKDSCSLGSARRYPSAATALSLLIALTAITLLHNRTAANTQSQFVPFHSTPTNTQVSRASNPETYRTSASSRIPRIASPEAHSSSATAQVAQGFSLGSHTLLKAGGVLTPASTQDPDQIALAETLAPSLPAPPLPLTQEQLLVAAARPGQPIQLAELDFARAPQLRAAAEARQTASLDRYVKTLFAPFAVADALQPTTDSQPQEALVPALPPSN